MEAKSLASANVYDGDLNSQKKIKISEVLIKNWTYWMASEIVILWQSEKEVNIKVEDVLQSLNLDNDFGFNKLSSKLINKKQELEDKASIDRQPDIIRKTLEVYYYDIIAFEIKDLSQELQEKSIILLKNLIDVQFDRASPEKLMFFLQQLIHKLLGERGKLEKKKNWNFEREKSAWNSFYKLHDLQENKNIWNAVTIALKAKLEFERCNYISFLIVELIQICQSYSGHVKRSFTVLENIKNSLKDKNSLNIAVSIPVFTLLNKVNVDEQEKLIEVWIGSHKLNYWGNSPASWQQIENKLLSNIEPVVLSIFAEFEACFVEHLTI